MIGVSKDAQLFALRLSPTLPRRLFRVFLYLLVTVGSIGSMFPFIWAISSSGKSAAEIQSFPPLLFPTQPMFVENYLTLWTTVPFGHWLFNSAYIAVVAVVGVVASASLVAYSFTRFSYPGRDLLFALTLATMMLPFYVTLIPSFEIFHLLGWIDTYNPLIVPAWFGGGAFNIFLMRQFLLGIPTDLDEAAEIDGASSWAIFWRILMPLSKPALATMAILAFIGKWNDFLGPLIYLSTESKFTVVLGLQSFFQGSTIEQQAAGPPKDNLLMAASVLAALPPILLFFATQRYFVQGIVTTGLKG